MPKVSKRSFVKDYALNCYTFDGNKEDYFIAKLVNKYMSGKRILDLGCGPVVAVTSIFYPDAKEVVAVDLLRENLDFVKNHSGSLSSIVKKALILRKRHFLENPIKPKVTLVKGNIVKKLPLGKFDAVMNLGAFGALDTEKDFFAAVKNAYAYLKKGGTLLMVNWVGNVKRPYHFNGRVNEPEVFKPAMEAAGFKMRQLHITSKYLSQGSRSMGYKKIIWAVAEK